MDKKVHILYVTFNRDHDWLNYSMESIKRYCSGFSGVTIVVPIGDVSRFLHFESYSTPECPVLIKGFVHHLAMKCYADAFCPTADYILHMDPDCLFHEKVTPEDYFVDGKPVLVIESFDVLKRYFPERAYWKHGVDEALGIDAKFETMCRHPAIHCAEIYPRVRRHVERIHTTPFTDYYLKGKNSWPQNRSEFPVLGAYAVDFMPDRYSFWDCSLEREKHIDEIRLNLELKTGHPPSKVTQFWSHHPVKSRINEIRKILP
jgi:hypothetical protein